MNIRLADAFEAISTGVQEIIPSRWQPAFARYRHLLGALLLACVAALVWYLFVYAPTPPPAQPHAVPVTAAIAQSEDLPISLSELGAAQAWTSVTVLAQVSGKLLSVDFAEGTDVRAGQVLAEIDPSPYRAALTVAQGALKRDEALLANAKLDLTRYQALVQANAVSRQQVDTQAAQVKQDEGTVLLDKGEVDAATVNLNWCHITAPISGRVGVRLVDPGNLVSASGSMGSTPATASSTNTSAPTASGNSGSGIVIVNQIEPIAVTFTVPEGEFQRLISMSDAFSRPMVVKAYSQESGELLDTGELRIADNRVDPTTGTVEMKARFPNAARKLWPGQFVNVQLTLQVLKNATTVPVSAVNEGPNGSFLYVVGADKTVSMRPIVVAWSNDTVAAITSGVRPGETVVTDGQMILKAGSLVRIVQPVSTKRQAT